MLSSGMLEWLLQTLYTFKPSLNTQSCIKGLLLVRDFCFWAVWAAKLVQKNIVGRLWATFECSFFMFSESKKKLWVVFFEKHYSFRSKKLQNKLLLLFFSFLIIFGIKLFSLRTTQILKSEGLLLQDWVFSSTGSLRYFSKS